MSPPERASLTWPPADVPAALAAEAVALLTRHHDVVDAADGPTVGADLAAAAAAEHLVGLRRYDGLGEDVERVMTWLQGGGSPTPVQAPPLLVDVLGDALDRILDSLRKRAHERGPTAAAINEEAGTHHIAADVVTLRAAIRAGHASLAAMPYYELRYGSRGRRFTASDTGWLATLAELGEPAALRHVDWLAGVLATRGMPSLLLERHLTRLAEELTAATGHAGWDVLRTAADHLGGRRRRVVGDDDLVAAEEEVHAALGDVPVEVPHTGTLIAAAVADAINGLTRDVEPCIGWLADPGRFPSAWCRAVRRTERRCLQTAGRSS